MLKMLTFYNVLKNNHIANIMQFLPLFSKQLRDTYFFKSLEEMLFLYHQHIYTNNKINTFHYPLFTVIYPRQGSLKIDKSILIQEYKE
jgi:hypothetical protein